MLRKLIGSTTFRKTFLSYVAILIILVLIFILTSGEKNFLQERNKIYNNHTEDAKRISGAIDDKLKELKKLGEIEMDETWVKKLMVTPMVYSDEFDFSRNLEIKQSMENLICPVGILSFGGLLYPDKSEIITQWGSYESDYFFMSIASLDVQSIGALYNSAHNGSAFDILQPSDVALWGKKSKVIPVVQSLEIADRPRAVLILFIDCSYLSTYINRIQGTGPISINITNGEQDIYKQEQNKVNNTQSRERKIENFNINSQVGNWKYSFTYPDSAGTIIAKVILALILELLFMMVAAVILAFLLASISYKPLYMLISKISLVDKSERVEKKDSSPVSEYSLIEGSFNQLLKENSTLHQVVDDYKSAARCNMLLRLLKGYFNDEQQIIRLKELGLNYTDDMYYCTLLINFDYTKGSANINESKRIEIIILASIELAMERNNVNYQLFEVDNAQKAIIISSEVQYEKSGIIRKVVLDITEEIQKGCGIKPDVLSGNVERGLIGISKSYYKANEELQYILFSRRNAEDSPDKTYTDNYYYPTDWEVQLINNLKIGNLNTLTHILDEIKGENYNRNLSDNCMNKLVSLIMETILRVLNELNIDTGIYAKQFASKAKMGPVEALWNYIYEVGSLICERIGYSNTTPTVELGNRLLLYVNNNYTSIDMSLKKLAEVFDMSVSSISRMFKVVTGINFYDYICRLRMEKAKELLREKTSKVDSIAKKVGYENSYSFRRAFVRYEGIKPDEYIIS
jgi:AraC-type DNA-binding domain-containing proteins